MRYGVIIFILLGLFACENHSYAPKPRGYPRIELPHKSYFLYDSACPFTFKVPAYAAVLPDQEPGAQPCWLNIYYRPFDAKLYLSYKEIDSFGQLHRMMEDSRNFVYKHTVKANEINEKIIHTPSGVSGLFYDIQGNVATAVQFFVTDSTKHFLRGALYFHTNPNRDSLQPVIDFLRKDIVEMINSLKWKEPNDTIPVMNE